MFVKADILFLIFKHRFRALFHQVCTRYSPCGDGLSPYIAIYDFQI